MAVVKANFVRRGGAAKARAKATIRYMLHRPGKEQTRTTRMLFGVDGVVTKRQAYRLIDEATRGTRFFRIVVSPDPRREDRERDLDLWTMTTQTIQALEERLRQDIHWVAVEHDDHAANRHVHTLVLVRGKLTREDFAALRQAATTLALAQRRERDLARGDERQQRRRGEFLRVSSVASHPPWEPHAKPLITTRPCYRCGEEQPVSRTEEHRCSSCGATLSRYGPANEEKGVYWG